MTGEHAKRVAAVRARARMYKAVRDHFISEDFLEVETPCLVPAPGMEPHITAFEVPFLPETDVGERRTFYLHTSPEYAMKRLLAEGFERIFQVCKVFRNGEISSHHNPEFTMLEFYRAHADYAVILADLEAVISRAAREVAGATTLKVHGAAVDVGGPFERLTVREALRSRTGIDLTQHLTAESFQRAAEKAGIRFTGPRTWDDVFFQLFLEKVEPTLGRERPTFLVEYPAAMASLARLKPGDPTVAERFELYVAGVELANGFGELNDEAEQRRRLVEERQWRRQAGRPVYPLDEKFLAAVGKMPQASGVALGLDRLLMLLTGAEELADVLLFPAKEFFT